MMAQAERPIVVHRMAAVLRFFCARLRDDCQGRPIGIDLCDSDQQAYPVASKGRRKVRPKTAMIEFDKR
jgi:hypothetical protein